MRASGFETTSVSMVQMLEVRFWCPAEDVDRLLACVHELDPLAQGPYDSNSYETAPGTERYRPLDGAAAGIEADVRTRPNVVEVCFELPDDQALLEHVVEGIFQAHSYQEPVIKVQPVLVSRSRGLDDSENPNRWWNTTGDWKKATG